MTCVPDERVLGGFVPLSLIKRSKKHLLPILLKTAGHWSKTPKTPLRGGNLTAPSCLPAASARHVDEWNAASKGHKLPKKKRKSATSKTAQDGYQGGLRGILNRCEERNFLARVGATEATAVFRTGFYPYRGDLGRPTPKTAADKRPKIESVLGYQRATIAAFDNL